MFPICHLLIEGWGRSAEHHQIPGSRIQRSANLLEINVDKDFRAFHTRVVEGLCKSRNVTGDLMGAEQEMSPRHYNTLVPNVEALHWGNMEVFHRTRENLRTAVRLFLTRIHKLKEFILTTERASEQNVTAINPIVLFQVAEPPVVHRATQLAWLQK